MENNETRPHLDFSLSFYAGNFMQHRTTLIVVFSRNVL